MRIGCRPCRARPARAWLPRSAAARPALPTSGERGIGLFEVIAGTLVATIAVIGLAYSFGIGRGLIDRYEVARVAMGEAQRVADSLVVQPPTSLVPGSYSQPFVVQGSAVGTTSWTISWVDDPADGLGSDDPNPNDMKRVTVLISWRLGVSNDSLGLSRLVLAQ